MSVEKTPSHKLCKAPVDNREHIMLIFCPAFQSIRARWWLMLGCGDMVDAEALLDHRASCELTRQCNCWFLRCMCKD